MKKFYFLLVLTIVVFNVSFSAPVIKSIASANWATASAWDLNRMPQIGDTIEVQAGNTITVNSDIVVNGGVFVKIYGTVSFQNNNSTLSLASPSKILVYEGGNITGVSASEKIRIAGSIVFQGNNPVSGPVMASSTTTGFVSFSSTPLPVKFVGFTLSRKSSDILVQWSTSQQVSADHFQIERSLDGSNWNSIGSVTAAGNSFTTNNYSFTDKNISSKIVYYRIKEVDFDGSFAVTPVKSIKAEASNDIKIASIQNKVLLQFSQEVKGTVVVRFVSQNGQVADQQTISNPFGQVVLNSKVTGNYIISLSNGQDINTAKQVIL